jgi:HlyD family secretion protein
MRRHRLSLRVGVVLVSVLLPGAFWVWQHRGTASTGDVDNSSSRTPAVPVHVARPQQGGVARTVTRPASVHSFAYAKLITKVSGYLQDQQVDIGSEVKQGQLLAQLFAPEIEADVRKAESDLAKAQAHVEVAQARVAARKGELRQAQAKLGQAKADVTSAKAMLTLRQEQYARMARLASDRAVAQELVDEKAEARHAAEATLQSNEKAVVTATAGISAAEANITQAQAELADAKAQVQVAQAVLDRARAVQQYTQIRSPYTGVITQRGYHNGDFIHESSGSYPPVLTVARTDLMRVVVWVPEPDVPLTHIGLPAVIRIDALGGASIKGKVARTSRSEDPISRTMRTEIDVPNADDRLKEGMYGEVTIDLGPTKTGVTIPAAALTGPAKGEERNVFVVRDGRARLCSVKVGRNDGKRAEISAGLRGDDEVVVTHGPGLTDGARVQVLAEAKAPQADTDK